VSDVRMVKRREDLGLALEPLETVTVSGKEIGQL
jgi:hypothetical protein